MARPRRKRGDRVDGALRLLPHQLPLLLPADPGRVAALIQDLVAGVGALHPTQVQADDSLAEQLTSLQKALARLTGQASAGGGRKHGGSVYSIELTAALIDALQEEGIALPPHCLPLIPFADYVTWARAQRNPVTVRQIMRRFDIGRWAAYYWHKRLYGDGVPRGGEGTRA